MAPVRGGRTISSVARDLGIATWSLGRWVQADRAGQDRREPVTLAAESEEQRGRCAACARKSITCASSATS